MMRVRLVGNSDFESPVNGTGTAHMGAYDLASRRTGVGGSYARTGVPQAASPATYNVNNQLTNWKGASLTYDANGNLTSDGTNTYTWNARNQLVAISGGASASFQYDPFGRRVSKTIVGMTQYLYDGANPVQELSGTSASANLLTSGVDEYFQRTDLAGARSFLTDALGSTLALADSTGALQTQYTFEPFGSAQATGTATTNSFAYTGRELDATGLYFYRARYYNPQLQRFVSEDPIGFVSGGINLNSYADNNPVSDNDPTGLTVRVAGGDPQNIADYVRAINYLRQDSGMAGIISELDGSSTVYNVKFINNGEDSFDPSTNTIYWDPHSGCDVSSEEGTQSAALGLGHEMAHAQHPTWGSILALITIFAGRKDNWEEWRVISGPESTAAHTLGEPIRTDHLCTSTPWNPSPTLHTPANYPPSPPYVRPPHEFVH